MNRPGDATRIVSAPALHRQVDELNAVLIRVEDAGGELTPELEGALDGALAGVENKVGSVALAVDHYETLARRIDWEINRLQALKRTADNVVGSIRSYLHGQLRALGVNRIDAGLIKVWRQLNPASIESAPAFVVGWRISGTLPREAEGTLLGLPFLDLLRSRGLTVEPMIDRKAALDHLGDRLPKTVGPFDIDGVCGSRGESLRIK